MDNTKKQDNPNPRAKANPLSVLIFWWLKDLFLLGNRKDLTEEDLYNTLPEDMSQTLGDKLEKHWRSELAVDSKTGKKKPSLTRAIRRTFGWSYMRIGFFTLAQNIIFRIGIPVFLGKLVMYFNPGSSTTKNEAYIYAACLVCTLSCLVFSTHQVAANSLLVGMRVRIACCSLIYRKVLRLSKTALGQTAAGQMVNLLSNDVSRFDQLPLYLHYVWIMPIQTVIATYFIWQVVGVSALIGVGGLFLQTVPVQSYMSKLTSKLRLMVATRTDDRVRLMNEIISGIQVIKMYAWEKPFERLVGLSRKREIKVLRAASYLRGVYLAFMVFSERTSLYITVIAYVLLGNHISPDKVFALAQFFNILQLSMAIFYPNAVQLSAEAKVSIKRIENFLLMEENTMLLQSKTQSQVEDEKGKKIGVIIQNLKAHWVPNSITETLSNVSLRVEPGKLCAVIGPVGSGKSSLLQVLLGELPLSSGSMALGGTVSYASQEPWLFAGTVRQNILFGQPFEAKRYREVIRACALQRDIQLLPRGDHSVVGDRGTSLSGGQRARINLARAVYRNADIYLLDDPLSAVDTHVGKHLFDECISMLLADKTRILVTHQLQYLKESDHIVIINNGQVEAQGTYNELAASKVNFANLLTGSSEVEEEEEATKPRLRLRQQSSRSSSVSISYDDAEEEGEAEADENTEMIAKGKLKSSLYAQYFTAGSGILLLSFLALVLIIGQVASSGADFWVTYWTNQEELRKYYQDQDLLRSQLFIGNLNETKLLNDTVSTLAPTTLGSEDTTLEDNFTTLYDVVTEATLLTNRSQELTANATGPLYDESKFYTVNEAILIYSICIAGSILITTLRSIVFFKVSMNSSIGLHNKMFGSILRGSMRFFDTNPSGRVLNRFSKDMGAVDELLPRAMLESIQVFLVMCGILVMVTISNYYYLIPMAIIGFFFYKLRTMYLRTAQDVKRLEGTTRSPVFSHLAASLNGLTTVRSCGAQEMVRKEFDVLQDKHTSSWFLTVVISVAFGFWLDCLSLIFVSIVTFTFLIMDDGTLGGYVGLAISQSLILTGMLQHGIRLTAEVVNQMTSVERVLQYTDIEMEPALESEPGKKPPATWPSKGEVHFDHTSLRYSQADPPVLKDLEFKIEPTHKVGIVGRTGAGKSSLIAALFRLARLEGAVRIDDVNTLMIGLHDLRKKISIIPQEPVLFSATLRYNLDPFNEYPDHALWMALEEVELRDAVDGLDFVVHEGGSNFSVGQRQLVCLARAILRNNKILVLDEATANVDPQTDALIQQTIRRKFKDCTVLTIAHRLNTIMDSNKVLVMDAGEAVEYDHPHILLQNSKGIFYQMVQQTGKTMAERLSAIAEEAYLTEEKGEEVHDKTE
ncbi:ATP-binding cassette sub-family C member 4 [Anabrus simplex]|uniref:ATP-binding cassette sub-family C member 4 n=1 Tax=Anabrus simplex TaxID=316456 RepID=UPI0035A2D642